LKWLEISLHLSGELAEAVAEVLSRTCSGGVSVEGRGEDYEQGKGLETGPILVRAFLEVDEHLAENKQAVEQALWHLSQIIPLPSPSYREVEQEDWGESWKDHYQPIPVGDRLLILPAWLESNDDTRLPLILDPGMAFGTGTHPTTRLCLQAMENLLAPGQFVVDLGCGSGILSIAAARLGAGRILALDTDPIAVDATQDNMRRNGVHTLIDVRNGSLETLLQILQGKGCDLLLANILAPILHSLLEEGLADAMQPGATCILSGVLDHQAEDLIEAASRKSLLITATLSEHDWRALTFKKQGAVP